MPSRNVLGLSFSNSAIGWAVINPHQSRIVVAGCRVTNIDPEVVRDYEMGRKVTPKYDRNAVRCVRRAYQRQDLRRERLNRVLNILGFLPPHYSNLLNPYGQILKGEEPKIAWNNGHFLFQDSYEEMRRDFNTNIPQDWTIYYLRKKALTYEISPHELAWVLHHFNRKRGYVQIHDESYSQKKEWKQAKKQTEEAITNSGKRVGEYIYDLLRSNPDAKIIGGAVKVVDRSFYREELHAIISKQAEFHPELTDRALYEKCIQALYPSNDEYRESIANKDFEYLLAEDILLYQRPFEILKTEHAPSLQGMLQAESIRVVNDIFKKYGKPAQIRIQSSAIATYLKNHFTNDIPDFVTLDPETRPRLKKAWGVEAIWNEILAPRFERMASEPGDRYVVHNASNPLGEPRTCPLVHPLAFSKELLDHRYLAMNAIVMACSATDDLPWQTFLEDACSTLKNIIVSFQQDLRVVSRGAICKPLHKESIFGEVHLPNQKQPVYAVRKKLDPSFTENIIQNNIADPAVQKILLAHLERCGGKPAMAFSAEGVERMNSEIVNLNGGVAHKPIYKVRKYEGGEKFAIGRTGVKARQFVESAKGMNLFFAIYNNVDGKREFCTIPLRLVVESQMNAEGDWRNTLDSKLKQCGVVKEDSTLECLLSPGDLVYVPAEDNSISDYKTEHAPSLHNVCREAYVARIYKFVSATNYQAFFVPYSFARSIIDRVELSKLNKMERSLDGVMIKSNCVPIVVDRLGNIKKVTASDPTVTPELICTTLK